MGFKYSVFTVMTPDLTLEEVVQCLQEYGYDGVEWRVHMVPQEMPPKLDYWRGNRATVDFARIRDLAPEIQALSDTYELAIPNLGTYLSYKLLEDVEHAMQAAKTMNCPQIRVGAPHYDGTRNYNDIFEEAVEGYLEVAALARTYGVKALIELHMGTICPSASSGHRFVSNFDPDFVGVICDPGNMICEGFENWQMGMELLGPYLAHVHVKNAAWRIVGEEDGTKQWRTDMVPLREGAVEWLSILRALRSIGYDGWLSFEDFSPGDTRTKLVSNIQYLRQLESRLD